MVAWIISLKVHTLPAVPSSLTQTSFNLGDTILHSWEILGQILQNEVNHNIVCDVGMSVH